MGHHLTLLPGNANLLENTAGNFRGNPLFELDFLATAFHRAGEKFAGNFLALVLHLDVGDLGTGFIDESLQVGLFSLWQA